MDMTSDTNEPTHSNVKIEPDSSQGAESAPEATARPSHAPMIPDPDEYVDPDQVQELDNREMDAMMDQYLDQMSSSLSEGQLLSVTVIAIKADHVLVDVGDKSEGMIDLHELPSHEGSVTVKVGDVIDAVVKGSDAESGLVTLSYREAQRRRAMDMIEEAVKNETPVKGVITRTVKGGLIIDIGTTAFLPGSQIDLRRVENFESWVGREVEGLIIEYAPEKRRIILSRRKLLEGQREKQRHALLDSFKVGQLMDVTVKRVVNFGVFVDLGGIDGLIPRSEISWQRNAQPEDFLKEGDPLQVHVIEIQPQSGKITLSRRKARENPWDNVAERYPVDTHVTGPVVSITSYGAFVRLDEGMDGMIHISDMAWDASGKKPGDFVEVGQELNAVVLSVDADAHRMSLGLKQLGEDPWLEVAQRYSKGNLVKGKVTGLTRYGAFLELEEGLEGMIHVSDFTWDKRINQPRQATSLGEELEAVVLDVDTDRRRIALGVKQLTDNPVQGFLAGHKIGDVVEGEVVNVTEFGAFINLAPGLEGFMHISQFDRDRIENLADVVKVGERLEAKITRIDPGSDKISLSRRQMMKEQDRKVVASYMKRNDRAALNNMGELFGEINLLDDLPPGSEPIVTAKATQPQSPPKSAGEQPPDAREAAPASPDPALLEAKPQTETGETEKQTDQAPTLEDDSLT